MRKLTQLGEILVEMGVCDPQRVKEALDSQVVFGGRLGTNLLELGAVTEEELARALSRRYGVPCLYGELIPDARAIALLKPAEADRLEIVPYELSNRRLKVLCCDPSKLRELDELAFSLERSVVPVVVPEARLWALMRAHYGVGRPMRGVEVDWTRHRAGIALEREPEPAEDLMDEAQFASLYASRVAGPPPRPLATGPAREAPLQWTSPPTPAPAGPERPPGAPGPTPLAGQLVSSEELLAHLQAEATAAREPQEAIALGPAAEAYQPLSFAEAERALAGVTDRGAIARIVLRYARSHFRRVVLLAVHTRGLDGWEGLGEGLSPQAVARVHVPLGQPGILQTVVESRSHVLGPLRRTEANIRLLRGLGGGVPENAFAMPILARGQVVNVLYADDGRGRSVNLEGLGELLILAARISQTYDGLLERER